ncbi:MAG: hypothetical protein EOP48_27385, partial [Sphingobacteriales bacterium]
MSSITLDPDSFFTIAKNLNYKTFEQMRQINRAYQWAYEQIKEDVYKYYLKRDFDYKLKDQTSNAKDVYMKAYENLPTALVLFKYKKLPPSISSEELPKGYNFPIEQSSIEWIQDKIFDICRDNLSKNGIAY